MIECPLEDAYSPEIKCKNFINALNEFINDDNNDIDYSINNNKNVFNSFSSNSQSVIVLGDDNEKNNTLSDISYNSSYNLKNLKESNNIEKNHFYYEENKEINDYYDNFYI